MQDQTRIHHLSATNELLLQVFYECGDQGDTVSYKSCCEGNPDPRGQELPGHRWETTVAWTKVQELPGQEICPDTGKIQQLHGQKCKSFPVQKSFPDTGERQQLHGQKGKSFPGQESFPDTGEINSYTDKSARVFPDKRAARTQMRDNSWLDKSTRAYLDKIFTWTQGRDNSCMDKRAKVFPDKRASRTQVRLTVTRTKVPEFSRTRELPGHRWETRVMHGQCLFVHIYVVCPNVP